MKNTTTDWNSLKDKLQGYRSVYAEPIPSLREVNTIPDAPLCGGGKLTMALDGTHREVNFHISKSDFWAIQLMPSALFQKHHIRQVSLCKLGLTLQNAAGKTDGFQHVQDMSNAEIRSDLPLEGGMLHIRSAALAQQDLVIYELEAEGAAASVSMRLETANEHENFFILSDVHDENTVWLRKEHTSFMTFNAAAALRVEGAEKVRTQKDMDGVGLSFDVVPGKRALLVLSIKGGKDEYQHLEQALTALEEIGPEQVPSLLEKHTAWWKGFWMKSWVDLGDEVLERYYFGAQYVHGCSIDLDARAVPGLAGGWITTDNPIWGGTYTMNYNGEAPFWGLESSNRGEWILPYARVCLDYIPKGRALAKRLNTKGMVMPVMIGPWGVEDNDDALGQKSNASLAAMALIWHYEFTRDRDFLEQYLYPYLAELVDFWEVNIKDDGAGGYIIAESATRERTPGDLNPGPELGYLRRVLKASIAGSEELKVDADRRVLWQEILDNLADYPTMEVDGGLCYMEAQNRMEVSIGGVGDNPVVLDHVYPGGAIDDDPTGKGRIIARNTLRYLDSWNQGNGFPRIFSQAVRAEWQGGELLDIFKARITRGPGPHEIVRRNNTFISEDHSYEGSGSTEFINAMLANAQGGVLKVFDVWPRERDAFFSTLRVAGAFLVSGSLKDGVVESVEILSEQGQVCHMKSCWPGHAVAVEGVDGGVVEVSFEEGISSWETEPGTVYRISAGVSAEDAVQNLPVMLVPVIDPTVRAKRSCTGAALDILLTPEIKDTQLEFDVVFPDESRRRCTADCRFSSRDVSIAEVSSDGHIKGGTSGRTVIDAVAEIDGEELRSSVSVYLLARHVLMDMDAVAHGKGYRNHWEKMHRLGCMLKGDGTDGPDVTSLHRTNSYGVGLFVLEPDEDDGALWVQFDFGKVYALDEMYVWNYNCPPDYRVLWWNGGTAVGMRDVTIEYSEDGQQWEELTGEGHPFRLAQATGKQWMPASNLDDGKNSPINLHGVIARYVKVTPDPRVGVGNWGDERFGLGQVRFTYQPPA